MHTTSLFITLILGAAAPVASFNLGAAHPTPFSGKVFPSTKSRAACPASFGLRMQLADPDAPVKIPDTFNPAEWGRGGGGLGGGGLGGFTIPDTFNPSELQREQKKGSTAVMDRPKLDPGKKYKVLLFNDENNTREYVIDTLVKIIPGMTAGKAKAITEEAHTNGLALVGIWMFELAEAYSDMLRSSGLKSDIEEE